MYNIDKTVYKKTILNQKTIIKYQQAVNNS